MNMLTYECVFGEKGMDADCELEWERKTIEGNVCIRLAPSPFAAFGPPGSLDKWQEEVEEQFVWPGRPALLPDGRLCVPTLKGLQIVAPAEEIKCFPNSKKMLKDQGRWGGEEKEWPVEGADAAGRRAIRASRVYQTLNRPTCVVVSPGGAVFVLEGGKDCPYGQTTPAALKKFSWSEGKMELQGAAEGLELSAYKGDLALGASALYVLDGLKVPPQTLILSVRLTILLPINLPVWQLHVLDLETLKSAREPIGLKECAPHAVAVVALGGELFVADGCSYFVAGGETEHAATRVVVLSEAGELKRPMPLPTAQPKGYYNGFKSLTALRNDKLLAVTEQQLVVMSTQGEGEALQVSRPINPGETRPRGSWSHQPTLSLH